MHCVACRAPPCYKKGAYLRRRFRVRAQLKLLSNVAFDVILSSIKCRPSRLTRLLKLLQIWYMFTSPGDASVNSISSARAEAGWSGMVPLNIRALRQSRRRNGTAPVPAPRPSRSNVFQGFQRFTWAARDRRRVLTWRCQRVGRRRPSPEAFFEEPPSLGVKNLASDDNAHGTFRAKH